MAKALSDHWRKVFSGQALRTLDMQRWLEAAYPGREGLDLPPPQDNAWRVRRRDVARAVRLAGKSAPGPDGIPYSAWKALQAYGVDCLWAAMQEMCRDDVQDILDVAYYDEESCNFNLSLLACLPKKTTGTTCDGTPFAAPEDTRPISMVDTANRLLANAVRLRWEPVLGAWVSEEQRGFVPDRSLLMNVVDLEDEAMLTSLQASEGGVLLVDFAAAFPSVSQDFLRAALAHIGVPTSALNILAALYYRNGCLIQVQGCRYPGFAMTAGIRQGCPLSPLLFITAMDGLIRVIQRKVRDSRVRAFADDTAVVLQDLKADLPILHVIFSELERASGLRLNVKKCILIPLGDRGPLAIQMYLERSCSPWFGVKVSLHGRYLGFEIGPEKGVLSWSKSLEKAWERVEMWDWSSLGLFYVTQVWNVMVISLLSFVSQLESPPQTVLAAEEALLRKVAPGPHDWCRPSELRHLKRAYGFASEFRDVASTAAVAQLRVVRWANWRHGGLRLCDREARLQQARRRTLYPDRDVRWSRWYASSHAAVLEGNQRELRNRGVTVQRVESAAAGDAVQPWDQDVWRRIRTTFQRTARSLMQATEFYDALAWTRHKLELWGIRDRRDAERSLRRLQQLGDAVPPRVMAAAIGCVWSRWTTARRFQNRRSACLLGCGDGEDSIKHYSGCRIARSVARRWLGMSFRISDPLAHWTYSAPTCAEIEATPGWWARVALLQYAVNRTTNSCRHRRPMGPEEVDRALHRSLVEGARGHRGLAAILSAS